MTCPDRSRSSIDVLRWPVMGRMLRWRHARTALQLIALLFAVAIVLHGLFGPQIAPRNLATVLTWVHYRGLLVVALLAAGNLFCTGCPFILVRDAARQQHRPARGWPARLRNKWLGIALFASVLFIYELFDLWALPRATAWPTGVGTPSRVFVTSGGDIEKRRAITACSVGPVNNCSPVSNS